MSARCPLFTFCTHHLLTFCTHHLFTFCTHHQVFVGMIVNSGVVLTLQLIRMFPLTEECAQCELDGNPYGGMSRFGPGIYTGLHIGLGLYIYI